MYPKVGLFLFKSIGPKLAIALKKKLKIQKTNKESNFFVSKNFKISLMVMFGSSFEVSNIFVSIMFNGVSFASETLKEVPPHSTPAKIDIDD
jgi:hypothetical protein